MIEGIILCSLRGLNQKEIKKGGERQVNAYQPQKKENETTSN